MKKTIDCLFIGHNESNFVEYEKNLSNMGQDSGAYRDLNLNFIRYLNKPYSASEIFNLFYCSTKDSNRINQPLVMGETFNAAIAYLGTYLNRRGFTFDYVNSFQQEKEKLAEKLEQENILLIAIITTLYVAVFPIMEIMNFIKKHNQTAKIVIGGPFVSNQVRVLEPAEVEYLFESIGADIYVCSSQGEATLVKIIDALKNHSPLEHLNNIYFKKGESYVTAPILQENNRLSENMVDWNLFSNNVGKFVNLRTSISCPFLCVFCGFPEHAGKYQTARVKDIEKELNQLAGIKTVQCVQFIDDTLNVPPKRFKEILRMIIKNKYKFRWHSHFRCQFADRETVQLMKESGCEGVFLGIESANNQILKNMKKGTTVEQYLKGIELLKAYGILTYGSFIIGFPNETDRTVEDTIQFIKKGTIDFYRVQLWYCDPITPIWNERQKYNITGSHFEWSHNTMDSKTACDIIDEIFLTIRDPIWVPQYNFECDAIFHLLHRGLSLQWIKNFLTSFNNGIREKLTASSSKSISFEVVKQLKKYCQGKEVVDDDLIEEKSKIKAYDVGFNY